MAASTVVVNGTNGMTPSESSPDMITSLSTSAHSFLQPSHSLHAAATFSATQILDPLADTISQAQKSRRDEARRKRKRGELQAGAEEPILQLRQVYTKGFKVAQVWEQVKRVLDATEREIEDGLPNNDTSKAADPGKLSHEPRLKPEKISKAVRFEADGVQNGMLENEGIEDEAPTSEDSLVLGEIDGQNMDDEEEVDTELELGEEESLNDESLGHSSGDEAAKTFVTDSNGLNDGFFSIDQFNRQSQFLEQRDALGQDDGAASDEEDVDWSIDPLAAPTTISTGPVLPVDKDSDTKEGYDDDEDEDEGPTFGDADLDASSDEDAYGEGELDLKEAMPGLDNTNDIKYTDFFEPPPKAATKAKRLRPLPKTQPEASANDLSDLDVEMQRAMADVRRDLFDEEEDLSDSVEDDDEQSDGPTRQLSTHEKQRAKIAKEIARLEAANVSKRDWTLSGEARAVDRPMNSLIEEDLDFERTGKPVPVVTAEVSEEIEDLIKRRILSMEFDEVLRRRPDAVGAANEIRRGRVELDNNRPQQSLADIYESEHLAKTDPNYKDPRSEKLKKEHAEIDRLWKDVSAKLDTLSNLNYKPRRPEANINVVTDTPTITIEDARPTADGINGDRSRLAPQEVYNPSHDASMNKAEEIMRKGGATIAREEMSREEKLRRRRRDKERRKKGKVEREAKQKDKGGKAGEKQDILKELRKGGVKVIGKKGDVRDIEGKKARDGIGKAKGTEGMKGAMLKL